jgi:hypothetical protein
LYRLLSQQKTGHTLMQMPPKTSPFYFIIAVALFLLLYYVATRLSKTL